ncbi:hypothetical protein AMTR_s00079p00101030 [Amborella trichopoda]|uniref:Ribosomal protein L34Ae n=1 Tax=Amborella trichopoda TaxID=13333 RepID=W1P287_AMBTC|nr:hypothetical protein AMTR_s00079p00101030 [Amborella trichopoda]
MHIELLLRFCVSSLITSGTKSLANGNSTATANMMMMFELLGFFHVALFLHSSILLFKLFHYIFIGREPTSQRSHEKESLPKEESCRDSSEEWFEREDLIADVTLGGKALVFLPCKTSLKLQDFGIENEEFELCSENIEILGRTYEEAEEIIVEDQISTCSSSVSEVGLEKSSENLDETVEFESLSNKDQDSPDQAVNGNSSYIEFDLEKEKGYHGREGLEGITEPHVEETHEELQREKEEEDEEEEEKEEDDGGGGVEDRDNGCVGTKHSFGEDTITGSSFEWGSSTNYRDSELEDLCSTSSLRSSSARRGEFDSMYKKYDDKMVFLDRISSQKLHEAESFRAAKVGLPRSISQRLSFKMREIKNENSPLKEKERNTYQELEATYVAQICLTWEALNWNYKNLQQIKASKTEERESEVLNYGYISQQFQQFQVLLQRFIEDEPFELGKRPEVFARMRSFNPKLLQVPEFRDADQREEGTDSTVSIAPAVAVVEEAIVTFMNFLIVDRGKSSKILRIIFKRNQSSTNPTLLKSLKKDMEKKKRKLKDLTRRRKCIKRRIRRQSSNEMEILMGLIDLKVISRVLRMSRISTEQLKWCEEKLSRVTIYEGKLFRDFIPIMFPSH